VKSGSTEPDNKKKRGEQRRFCTFQKVILAHRVTSQFFDERNGFCLAHPRSPIPILSTLTSRATHAHPTSPHSTGFCAIWDCISSSCKGKNSQWFSSVAVALLQQEINKTSGEIYSTDE